MGLSLNVPILGTLVGLTAEPYEITDRDTGSVNRGTSRRAYVSQGFDQAPLELRFGTDAASVQMFDVLAEAGEGAPVNVDASVRDQGRGAFLKVVAVHGAG